MLPQTSASGNIHIGTITGKLNGVMPAVTPSGWRSCQLSMPPPTLSECRPESSRGAPQANSTTSMPRVTSPSASASTLPCSRVMASASGRRFCPAVRGSGTSRVRDAESKCAPSQESRRGRGNGAIHQCRIGHRHAGDHFAGGGIEHLRLSIAAAGCDEFTAYEMSGFHLQGLRLAITRIAGLHHLRGAPGPIQHHATGTILAQCQRNGGRSETLDIVDDIRRDAVYADLLLLQRRTVPLSGARCRPSPHSRRTISR